mmetsp:Transcript_3881/g.5781  ORF Transcript_3881/g.5781 Transcript_3881/m.5781 type:complete len:457 (+) Transcript_3881:34-1404(+)
MRRKKKKPAKEVKDNSNDMALQPAKQLKTCMIHSSEYTLALHHGMHFIHKDRDLLLSSLLVSCNLLGNSSISSALSAIPPSLATKQNMSAFHTVDYLNQLECYSSSQNQFETKISTETFKRDAGRLYGLEDDCSLPESHQGRCNLWRYCQYVAGASITAAYLLMKDDCWDIAINWGGGRHHAFASSASGFCFVNDTVLSIQHLVASSCARVLYLDIDIHHSDAVQEAFYDNCQVLTVSFHRSAPGFFPTDSRSSFSDRGVGAGFGYNVNIPLPQGLSDSDFLHVYKSALESFVETFQPNYIVLAVGADGLAHDPLVTTVDGGWHLTSKGIASCVEATVDAVHRSSTMKCLLLGGGGYSDVNAARTFVACTAAACGCSDVLPTIISSQDTFILRYSPDYSLHTNSAAATMSCTIRSSNKYQEEFSKAIEVIQTASDFIQFKQKYNTLEEIQKQDIAW